jgi:MFS family permease
MTLDSQTPSAVPPEAPADAAHRRRGLLFVGLAVAALQFTLIIQVSTNSNFVGQPTEMNLTGRQQGVLEACRETCGITALGVLAVLAGLAEPLVGAGMLVLVAVGMSAYTFVPSFYWLIAASLLWSQGFHVWVPLPQSMTIALAEPGRVGHRLGQIGSAGAVGAALGLGAAYGLNYLLTRQAVTATVAAEGVWKFLRDPIRPLFLVGGIAAVLGAAACLGIPRRIKTPGPRFVLRRKYWLYYLLCFLDGWRKQIFIAFAGFLLVTEYKTPLTTMLLLSVAIQAIGYVASPWVGRLIDRIGERVVLTVYFASLVGVFIAYAQVQRPHLLYVLYVLDSVLFMFNMALPTYVGRIAPASDRTPTLSMGVAFNHIAAVAMPLVGGMLWGYGYQWVFYVGAAVAAASILAALAVPRHARRAAA